MQQLERFIELCGGTRIAAERLGVNIRTVQKYRSENRIPRPIERYISVLVAEMDTDTQPPRQATN